MDKKNTMLLTVIAVATLLVAVVGATFAFFSVTGENSTSTGAAVTATTGDSQIGAVSIATTNAAMHITTTAAEFAQSAATTAYWAKAGAAGNSGTADYNASETDIVAFTLTATGSGVNYVCTVGVTADTTVTGGTNPGLVAGEYALVLKSGAADTNEMEVVTPSTNTNISKTFTIYVAGGSTATITAAAKLVNTNQAQNPRLVNASISTALAVSSFSCNTTASAGTNSVA